MKHYYCKSNHTFSLKQANVEAMTNVKLAYSSRLLKKKRYKGLRAKLRHFKHTQFFSSELDAFGSISWEGNRTKEGSIPKLQLSVPCGISTLRTNCNHVNIVFC